MKNIILILLMILSSASIAQEETKKVKVKKNKDGSNIYNFNFYNNKDDEKKKKKTKPSPEKKDEDIKDEDLVVYKKKKKKIKKGNGVEGGIFTMGHLGDMGEVSDLDLGLGLRIGYVMMNSQSGLYFTPGVFVINAGANFEGLGDNFMTREYDGSAFGGYLKVGKLIDRGSEFSIDAGVEGSYMSGDLDTDNIFGTGSYKFSAASVSAYGGPVFKVNNFLLTGLLNVGVSQIDAKETVTDSGFSPTTSNYSDKKMVPFYGLSVNATFVF